MGIRHEDTVAVTEAGGENVAPMSPVQPAHNHGARELLLSGHSREPPHVDNPVGGRAGDS
jgi:hypothetical protein